MLKELTPIKFGGICINFYVYRNYTPLKFGGIELKTIKNAYLAI
ncbi:Putative protein [Zobellia galactanivorans]|uniref:Uncharacterized protein n=1 Tax=Zobellia galactanivorans (strain DSM 12802 / CCUG 47099 / CIP 106680 / NCIMB 13871 / Dsij) TaxID=63186 RepID=G0LCJ6_ZOBGA|nr:Putative protein [Zobellia galactanivorans]